MYGGKYSWNICRNNIGEIYFIKYLKQIDTKYFGNIVITYLQNMLNISF